MSRRPNVPRSFPASLLNTSSLHGHKQHAYLSHAHHSFCHQGSSYKTLQHYAGLPSAPLYYNSPFLPMRSLTFTCSSCANTQRRAWWDSISYARPKQAS